MIDNEVMLPKVAELIASGHTVTYRMAFSQALVALCFDGLHQ